MGLTVRDYLRETTVHGFRYLVDEGASRAGRAAWAAAVAASFAASAVLVAGTLGDAAGDPISTSVASVPAAGVPFPAVTAAPAAPHLMASPAGSSPIAITSVSLRRLLSRDLKLVLNLMQIIP